MCVQNFAKLRAAVDELSR